VEVEDLTKLNVARRAEEWQGRNVEFVVIGPGADQLSMRVWERGVGETLACGTGACAAVVSGIRQGLLEPRVDVETRGGLLSIEWAGGAASVLMTGPAVTVFEGEIEL
jgi:diaminopimelate epimerase